MSLLYNEREKSGPISKISQIRKIRQSTIESQVMVLITYMYVNGNTGLPVAHDSSNFQDVKMCTNTTNDN